MRRGHNDTSLRMAALFLISLGEFYRLIVAMNTSSLPPPTLKASILPIAPATEAPWTRGDIITLATLLVTIVGVPLTICCSIACIKRSRDHAREAILRNMEEVPLMSHMRDHLNFTLTNTRHQLGLLADLVNRLHIAIQVRRDVSVADPIDEAIAQLIAEWLGPRLRQVFMNRAPRSCFRYGYMEQARLNLRWWVPIPQELILRHVRGIPAGILGIVDEAVEEGGQELVALGQNPNLNAVAGDQAVGASAGDVEGTHDEVGSGHSEASDGEIGGGEEIDVEGQVLNVSDGGLLGEDYSQDRGESDGSVLPRTPVSRSRSILRVRSAMQSPEEKAEEGAGRSHSVSRSASDEGLSPKPKQL